MPSDIFNHALHTTPKAGLKAIADVPPLSLDNLALLNKYDSRVYLTSNDDVTVGPRWIFGQEPGSLGKIHGATPCAVIVIEKNLRDFDAFYFYFYSSDQGANIEQMLPQLDRQLGDSTEGLHFGDHVGDW